MRNQQRATRHRRAPTLLPAPTYSDTVLGHGDIELEHFDFGTVWVRTELTRGALRQAQRSPSARKDNVRALFLRNLCHAECERRIGEDSGDHDVFSVEQTHPPKRSRWSALFLCER